MTVVEGAPPVWAHDNRRLETFGHRPQCLAATARYHSATNIDSRPLRGGQQLRRASHQVRLGYKRLVLLDRFQQRNLGLRLEYIRRNFQSYWLRPATPQLA